MQKISRASQFTGIVRLIFILVGVARLELAASCSQSRRATNCATPRYNPIHFCFIYPDAPRFARPGCRSPNFRRVPKHCLKIWTAAPAAVRFFCRRQRSPLLPKASALPTAQHPVIILFTLALSTPARRALLARVDGFKISPAYGTVSIVYAFSCFSSIAKI